MKLQIKQPKLTPLQIDILIGQAINMVTPKFELVFYCSDEQMDKIEYVDAVTKMFEKMRLAKLSCLLLSSD